MFILLPMVQGLLHQLIKVYLQGRTTVCPCFFVNYMTKLIFIIIFNIIQLSSIVGQTFQFEYSTPNDDKLWDVFETDDGNFFCVGHVAKPLSNHFSGLILKINADGQLVEKREYTSVDRSYDIKGILQDTLGALILCGSSSDTTPNMYETYLELRRIDYEFQILDSNSYLLDSNRSLNRIGKQLGFNNDLLFTGGLFSENPPPYSKTLLARLNQAFDSLIFIQHLGGPGEQISQLDDSTYWCIGWIGGYAYNTLDTQFNFIDSQQSASSIRNAYGLKWVNDTSFLMVGDIVSKDIAFIHQYHPMDTTGHLYNEWGKANVFDHPAFNGALDFQNLDSVYIGAVSPFSIGWPNHAAKYVILQTDSLLNVRWERFYGEGKYYYELMKVLATKDGGCLLAGTKYNYESGIEERDIYIIKLDSEGLIVGNTEHSELEMRESIVYPNPGTNEIKIRIAAQHPVSLFQLLDMNGKLVKSDNVNGKWGLINTTNLNPGTYIYRITSEQGLFETGKWIKQ